jgi:hypothetical protein
MLADTRKITGTGKMAEPDASIDCTVLQIDNTDDDSITTISH